MKRYGLILEGMLLMVLVSFLSSCTVSPVYVMEQDRVDQEMKKGNRGYIKGNPPPAPDRTGMKRNFIAIDIEFDRLSDDGGSQERKAYLEPARASKKEKVSEPAAVNMPKQTPPQSSPAKQDPYKKIK